MHILLDQFEKSCAAKPNHPAACDQKLVIDYQGLRAVAAGLAEQITARSNKPRVGILAPASAAGAAAILACWYADKIPVPLNFVLGPAELAKIISDADLDLVLTIEHFATTVQATGLQTIILNSQSLVPGSGSAPEVAPSDVAVVLYTSGTSGDPKGVCLSFGNIVRNVNACIEHARINSDQIFLSVLPQFHSFGFTALTIVPLLLGATVHYLPRFSPAAMVNTIADKQISVLIAIPSMLAALANMKQVEAAQFTSLRLTVCGGEPLPETLYKAFQQRFGVTIHEGFGMTESSPIATLNTPWEHRPGSVGRPIPGVNITTVDELGNGLPPGETGELVISGHCVMLGYHNKPDITAATIRDGALWTGDVGHVDADGYVYITGRAKEMIIVGGENVFPREIETVILEHPAVNEAAVIGVPDKIRGELPAAFVILKEDKQVTVTELRDFCRKRLAGYKVPRWIRTATDLPRSATGKILKRALKLEPS